MSNKTTIQFGLSLGIILLVISHALTLATAQRVLPHVEKHLGYADRSAALESFPTGGINWDSGRSAGGPIQTLPVNAAARDEVKRQLPVPQCFPCQDVPVLAQRQPTLVPSRTVRNVKPVSVASNRYSIALFISSDSKSKVLLDWFNRHPSLYALRQRCEFQVYTPSNLLYQSRFKSQVPPEAFPAMLFCDPTGGLVHALWKDILPSTADQLHADMGTAYELQKQVVAQRTQLVGAEAGASPAVPSSLMTLDPDCDGDNCQPREPLLDPDRDRVIPPLFDRDRDHAKDESIEGLLRAITHPGETFGVLMMVILIVVSIIVIRRIQNQ